MSEAVTPFVLNPKRKQFHVTAMEMLSRCGLQYEFVHVKGERLPPGIFRLVGSATHKTIHYDLSHKIRKGKLASTKRVKEFAAASYEEHLEAEPVELTKEDLEQGITLATAKDKSIGLSVLHHTDLAPTLNPVGVEVQFSLSIDDYLANQSLELMKEAEASQNDYARRMLLQRAEVFKATADRGADISGKKDIEELYDAPFDHIGEHEQVLTVRDSKCRSKSPHKDEANNSVQLAAYALGTQVVRHRLPDKMYLDCLIETPKNRERYIKSVSTVPTQADINVFLARLSDVIVADHLGVYYPAPADSWQCSERWCGFWHKCSRARRPTTSIPNLIQISK